MIEDGEFIIILVLSSRFEKKSIEILNTLSPVIDPSL